MPVDKDPGAIRSMFAAISPRYDLLNHLLSAGLDRSWRRRAVRALRLPAGALVLDVCTGTGDLALEIARAVEPTGGRVVGADFTPEMVRIGEAKRQGRGRPGLRLLVADTLRLPFGDGVFDAVTAAFGIRNLGDVRRGLRELRRVLKPGGQVAILEFSPPPRGLVGRLFDVYFRRLLPRIGGCVTGTRAGADAYAYLPASVSAFPGPRDFARLIEQCGFADVRWTRLTFGVCVLHVATCARLPALAGCT